MQVGTALYKFFLKRSLAAGRLLSQKTPFSYISLTKSNAILGTAVDVSQSIDSDDERAEPQHTNKKKSSQENQHTEMQATRKVAREVLLNASSSFRDLEKLFVVLDAMERWRNQADEIVETSQ